MHRFLLTFSTTFLLFFISSGKSVQETETTELNDRIRDIVGNVLAEKGSKSNSRDGGMYLEEKIKNLENKLKKLERTVVDQSRTIEDLQNVLQNMQMFGDVNQDIGTQTLTENATTNENYLAKVKTSVPNTQRFKRAAAAASVAFSAYLSQTNSHHVIGQAIRFDKVLINNGNGYNNYTGAFTAPLSGVYFFTFHFDTGELTFLRLVVNGVNVVDAVANPHTNAVGRSSHSMGGNSAIVYVNKGEAVLVEPYEVPDAETASSEKFRVSTFSGVLLY